MKSKSTFRKLSARLTASTTSAIRSQPRGYSNKFAFEDGEWWVKFKRGRYSVRHRARVAKCETCEREFVDFPHGKTNFCSKKCRRVDCSRCGKRFHPESARHKFCSLECKRDSGICENCGKSYVYSHHGAKRFCSKACFYEATSPVGSIIDDPSGYTLTKTPPGTPGVKLAYKGRSHWMWTHRYVMQWKLGRPLLKTERVHHINGRKTDNRPENLELWKRTHPAGVRSKDYHCAGCRCFDADFKCEDATAESG